MRAAPDRRKVPPAWLLPEVHTSPESPLSQNGTGGGMIGIVMTLFAPLSMLLLAALLAPAHSAGAQKGEGRLVGLIVDKANGLPVGNAELLHMGDSRSTSSDSTGAYRFDGLPSGIVKFVVRAKGFPATSLVVALARGESMVRRIELDSSQVGRASSAQTLNRVRIEALPSLGPRYADFERRRATGQGHYITSDEIEKGNFTSLQETVRGVRGVSVDCGGGLGCFIRMVRAPMQCPPEYVVDDHVDNFFGPNVAVRDIQAVEVYTGPSDVPGEYAGRNAGCGVIVIWTKSGPPKRKKP